jgi:hypothetical protein
MKKTSDKEYDYDFCDKVLENLRGKDFIAVGKDEDGDVFVRGVNISDQDIVECMLTHLLNMAKQSSIHKKLIFKSLLFTLLEIKKEISTDEKTDQTKEDNKCHSIH